MELNFLEVFLYSFFGVAVGYALLAGFTPIFAADNHGADEVMA